jgi:hypothetical protein
MGNLGDKGEEKGPFRYLKLLSFYYLFLCFRAHTKKEVWFSFVLGTMKCNEGF